MIFIQLCFFGLLAIAFFVGVTIWRIRRRGPAHKIRTEHRNAGERAWEDPSKIPAPAYAALIKLLSFVLAIVGVLGFALGFYISTQTQDQATEEILMLETLEVEDSVTETLTPEMTEQTAIAVSTSDLIFPTETPTPTPTDDLTITPYPTYTAFPTYTPYPTLESVVIERERIIIVTPVDQQPTVQAYYPQAQPSTYGRVVPDQRGQVQQQVYQPAQQPIYVYPTAQFVIPPWESYISPTPRATQTPRPTLSVCPAYVETMFMTPTPSAAWCYTATPTPTERVIITNTPMPTQTPYIIIVTETPVPTATATLTPELIATQTPLPIVTDVPTETPMPTFTPEPTATPQRPDPTPDEESPHEPTDDN